MPIKTCIIDSRMKTFSSNWRLEESKTTQRSHFPQNKWHSKNWLNRFWQQSFAIDCCIIDSAITFFSENGALNAPTPPEAFFLTSPVTHENWHLDVMTTICHNRLMQYWFNHHIFFWKWRSKCFNSTRSPLSHKPSDGQNSTLEGF